MQIFCPELNKRKLDTGGKRHCNRPCRMLQLRKMALVETVNDGLKNVCNIGHARYVPIDNFASNLIAGLIAYNLLPKEPSLNIDIIDKSRLIA